MSDIPIIFSAPMVRALIDCRKTMTRRLAWRVRPTKVIEADGYRHSMPMAVESSWCRVKPGDRLWVRENLCAMGNWGLWHDAGPIPKPGSFLDDLDIRGRAILERYAPTEATDSALVPSIFMPRWASRLTLVVTATKIERVQALDGGDARREGIHRYPWKWRDPEYPLPDVAYEAFPGAEFRYSDPREAFADLWRSIHGADAWDANPEVVALTFTVHKQNIDGITPAQAGSP